MTSAELILELQEWAKDKGPGSRSGVQDLIANAKRWGAEGLEDSKICKMIIELCNAYGADLPAS
jgi:hypothetical protein